MAVIQIHFLYRDAKLHICTVSITNPTVNLVKSNHKNNKKGHSQGMASTSCQEQREGRVL